MLRKGIVTVAAIAAVAVGGCATDPGETSEFQALEAQLVEAQSDLADAEAAARSAAETSRSELDALRTENDRLESRLTDFNAARSAASSSYARLADLVEVQVAWGLWVAPEDIEDLQVLGVDTSVGDQIIEERSWGNTWEEFALSSGGFTVNHLIAELDDEALETAWISYAEAPLGSDEEYAAISSFFLRLHELTIESLHEADQLLSTPNDGAV